jgi:hypothetical protein
MVYIIDEGIEGFLSTPIAFKLYGVLGNFDGRKL